LPEDASPPAGPSSVGPSRSLSAAERLDLLRLLWRQLARNLAAGHFLTLDAVADVVDTGTAAASAISSTR
jgi:hypothetical protein